MKRRPRRAALLVSSGLLTAALWSGMATPGAPTVALPSLSLSEVLSLANVKAPALGTGLKIHADFPPGRPFDLDGVKVTSVTIDITPAGEVVIANMISKPASGGDGSTGVHECDDRYFAPLGVTWAKSALPLRWVFNADSVPEPISKWRTEDKLIQAHENWELANNECGEQDSVDFSFVYGGRANRGVARDGHNSVVFGPLGGGAIAMNYLWYQGTEALETDLRLKGQDWLWANRTRVESRYQVINVSTHELGHQIGLDDLGGDHSQLTMYGVVAKGELKKRTLGRGDERGATLLSPKV